MSSHTTRVGRLKRLQKDPHPGAPEESSDWSGKSSPSPSSVLREKLDRLLGKGVLTTGDDIKGLKFNKPIDDFVDGTRVSPAGTPGMETFIAKTFYGKRSLHGRVSVSDLADLAEGGAKLFPQKLANLESHEIVFLDTETTGLSSGAGTIPFLIGVGRWAGAGFEVEQFFIENLGSEPAQLECLKNYLSDARCIVTYNGAGYDIPIIRNRFALNSIEWTYESIPHLDLLYPARALWKSTHTNCRLITLEESVVGFSRVDDVPGSEIPGLYRNYLRRGASAHLAGVFTHNVYDIVTLACLLAAMMDRKTTPELFDRKGLASLLMKSGDHDEACRTLRAELDSLSGSPSERIPTLRKLIGSAKRCNKHDTTLKAALELCELTGYSDPFPVEEAAKVLERKLRDPAGAAKLVRRCLEEAILHPDDRMRLAKRFARLERKLTP